MDTAKNLIGDVFLIVLVIPSLIFLIYKWVKYMREHVT